MGFQAAENEILAVVVRLIFQTFQEYICKNSPVRDLGKTLSCGVGLCTKVSFIVIIVILITPAWLVQQYYPEINTIFNATTRYAVRDRMRLLSGIFGYTKIFAKIFWLRKFPSIRQQTTSAQAAQAAVSQQSLLAVFRHGGGKSGNISSSRIDGRLKRQKP